MARKWTNQNIPGALHFITGNIIDRIAVFEQENICLEFLEICGNLRRDWPAKLVAYVLMPDHFHLIANPRDGDIRGFSTTMYPSHWRLIKTGGGLMTLRNSQEQ